VSTRGRRALFLLAAVLNLPIVAAPQDPVAADPSRVEAAFLRNFARYVTWPTPAFADEHSPWRVCVLGGDRFDDNLEKTFLGRTEQGRAFEVLRAKTTDQLPACQIVFVGHESSARRRAALQELRSRPVLTVGDAPGFLEEGGVIRFQVGQHVEMSINLDLARAQSLGIPAKMLEVSREVVENGTLRRLR
jgi:hypothetical protein